MIAKQTKVPYCVRQGDVLLVDAAYRGGMPKAAVKIEVGGDTILAHGEATGHAHRISAKLPVDYFDHQAERYLHALCEAPLTHEEHASVPIYPRDGGYQQAFQVEEKREQIQRVAD